MKFKVLTILSILLSTELYSQSSIEMKLNLIGVHPDKALRQDPWIYENKIDANGNFIFELGGTISYQKFIYLTALSFQFSQGIYSDAAAKMAGISNILLKYKLFHKYKFSIELGIGPSLSYRKDWHNVNRYVDNDGYTVNGKWQTKWMLGAEMGFYYYISNHSDISLSGYYGASYGAVLISIGYRYWFNSMVTLKTNCNKCGNKFSRGKFRHWWKRHMW